MGSGLPINWYYPSEYTAGTENSNVERNIQGQLRSSWHIGVDEGNGSAGTDVSILVGPKWETQQSIQAPYLRTITVGDGSQTITIGGGSQTITIP